jgi:hypothetical protein
VSKAVVTDYRVLQKGLLSLVVCSIPVGKPLNLTIVLGLCPLQFLSRMLVESGSMAGSGWDFLPFCLNLMSQYPELSKHCLVSS